MGSFQRPAPGCRALHALAKCRKRLRATTRCEMRCIPARLLSSVGTRGATYPMTAPEVADHTGVAPPIAPAFFNTFSNAPAYSSSNGRVADGNAGSLSISLFIAWVWGSASAR